MEETKERRGGGRGARGGLLQMKKRVMSFKRMHKGGMQKTLDDYRNQQERYKNPGRKRTKGHRPEREGRRDNEGSKIRNDSSAVS